MSRPEPAWVFDTRMFHDAGSRKHVGSNDEIVDGIVQRRLACRLRRCPARFPQFLDSLWYAWMINRQISKGSQVRIVVLQVRPPHGPRRAPPLRDHSGLSTCARSGGPFVPEELPAVQHPGRGVAKGAGDVEGVAQAEGAVKAATVSSLLSCMSEGCLAVLGCRAGADGRVYSAAVQGCSALHCRALRESLCSVAVQGHAVHGTALAAFAERCTGSRVRGFFKKKRARVCVGACVCMCVRVCAHVRVHVFACVLHLVDSILLQMRLPEAS